MILGTNFQIRNSRKVNNYGQIVSANCLHRQNWFIPQPQYTAEGQLCTINYGKKRYSKFMLYPRAKELNLHLLSNRY
jgi:hypothetical protein